MSHSILIESPTRLTLEPGCATQLTGISAMESDSRRARNKISTSNAKPTVFCREKIVAAASRRNILKPHCVSAMPSRASSQRQGLVSAPVVRNEELEIEVSSRAPVDGLEHCPRPARLLGISGNDDRQLHRAAKCRPQFNRRSQLAQAGAGLLDGDEGAGKCGGCDCLLLGIPNPHRSVAGVRTLDFEYRP
jgi:hypothetical protein